MAEGRMLKKRISESKKLAALSSDSPRLIYTWLIPWLDIADRFSADPDIIKGSVFPKIKSWTKKKIMKCLEELHDIGLIVYYEVKGEKYLQFTQTLQKKYPDREAASIIPAPSKEALNSCGLMSTHAKIKLKEKKLNKEKLEEIYEKYEITKFKTIEEFFDFMYEEMWRNWPKDGKLDKEMGREKFHARCYEGLLGEIISGANGYLEFLSYQKINKNFDQQAMYPKTFLEPKKARWKEFIGFKRRSKL